MTNLLPFVELGARGVFLPPPPAERIHQSWKTVWKARAPGVPGGDGVRSGLFSSARPTNAAESPEAPPKSRRSDAVPNSAAGKATSQPIDRPARGRRGVD